MTDDTDEIWTIDQVVEYLGAASPGSARRTLSRWGVKAVEYRPDPTGRPAGYWSANAVRAAKNARARGVRNAAARRH